MTMMNKTSFVSTTYLYMYQASKLELMSVKNSCSTQLDSFYISKTAGLKHIYTHICTVY